MVSTPSALRSAVVVSLTRGSAAVLALAQGVLSARYFGTSYQKDAYLVAQTIPTMVSSFLIGGVYSSLLVNLAEVGRVEGARGQRAFAGSILRRLVLVFLPPLAIVLVAPGLIVALVAPGFAPESIALAASLLRLTALGAAGVVFMAAVRCLFEVRGQFIAPAIVGLATPLVSLVVLVALVGSIGIYTLAVGSVLGVALALALLVAAIPLYVKDPEGYVPYPVDPVAAGRRARGFWLAFLPLSIGSNFGQINVTVDNAFASNLPTGSITMLAFAFVIVSNAQLLTTSTFAEISFTRLAANAGAGSGDLKALFRSQIRHILLLTAPLGIGALVFAAPLVRLLFERGAFTPEATLGVTAALNAYAPGMFFMGYLTLFSVFLMSQRRFVRISATAVTIIAVNAVLDFILMRAFGLTGIALGTSLTILIHASLLMGPVRRILGGLLGPGDGEYHVKVLGSAAIMGGVVLAFAGGFERLVDVSTQGARLVEAILGLAIGGATYIGALHLLRVDESRLLLQRLAGPLVRFVGRSRPEARA